MNKPLFISLEGVDGAGKTTHIHFIEDYFRTKGLPFYMTREPGGTDLGEKLRLLLLHEEMDALTETMLMFAARCEHIQTIIKPKLDQGITVVSDRFTDATYAYQAGGKGVDARSIDVLKSLVQKDLDPDLTFLFDVPVEISIERLKDTRTMDKFEREEPIFHQSIRNAYLDLAQSFPQRFHVLNGTHAIEAIQDEIKLILDRRLG
ncbi:thymidylate kinase [Methylophilales bacterium HTCC2181]|jgi:dTMP kinase|uniref:Thymidylate kinase n=1 Tax=Methylophilales bacterium HTCC2181 TaxID=383631 RepID=A0P6Y1_9PROT|nr:thymidylate kinase [Methylophilales bacterium HTCC2181]